MLAGTRTRTALRIDVVDNGPGVPEHLKERIFFPLVTGRAELGPRTRIGKDLCGGSRRKHYARKPSRPDGLHGTAAAGRTVKRVKTEKQRTAKVRSESLLKTL